MKHLIYILLFVPLVLAGQTIPDKKYHAGQEVVKTYHQGVVVWSAENPELYTTANAISINDEANSLTGISEVGSGTLSVQSSGAHSGTYFARLIGSGGVSERIEITWSGFTIGQHIRFSFAGKRDAGGSAYVNAWTGVQAIGGGTADPHPGGGSYFFPSDEWTSITYDLELTATSGICRFYSQNGTTTIVDVDSFSMTEL